MRIYLSLQPTAEQIRIAQITDISSGSEDPEMREKVQTLIEMTQRSEEEVCCALNECDNNLEKAVEFLLETLPVVSICNCFILNRLIGHFLTFLSSVVIIS